MDALTLRDGIITALAPLNADVTTGAPATDSSGRVRRTVIVGTTPGTASNRRAAGGTVDRDGLVDVLVVTPSADSCVDLADQTRDLLADYRIPGAGLLVDESYDAAPAQEPDITPARWSTALAFRATRKRNR